MKRVLDYAKLDFTAEEKLKLMGIVYSIADIVEISGNLKVIKEDPDDNIILESAISGKADYIITGDRHLLNLKEYLGIKILTNAEFSLDQ